MIISQVGSEEGDLLQKVSLKTFEEAFGSKNKPENLTAYLEASFSKTSIRNQLTNPESKFYFGRIRNDVAGYLKLNFGSAQNEVLENPSMEIERIYVLSEFQGSGLGQKFIDHAIEISKKMSTQVIWLGVWDQNAGAIRFYERLGFKIFGSHPFQMGDEIQSDLLMKLEIAP